MTTTNESTSTMPTPPEAIQFTVVRVMRESWMIYRARFLPLLGGVIGTYGAIALYFWITELLLPPPGNPFGPVLAVLLLVPLIVPLNGISLFMLNICRTGKADYTLLWRGGTRFLRVFKAWWVGYHIVFQLISCL